MVRQPVSYRLGFRPQRLFEGEGSQFRLAFGPELEERVIGVGVGVGRRSSRSGCNEKAMPKMRPAPLEVRIEETPPLLVATAMRWA